MRWHFCIDTREKRTLNFCADPTNEGDGYGAGLSTDIDGRGYGTGGYINGDGSGVGSGVYGNTYSGDGDGVWGYLDGNGKSSLAWK